MGKERERERERVSEEERTTANHLKCNQNNLSSLCSSIQGHLKPNVLSISKFKFASKSVHDSWSIKSFFLQETFKYLIKCPPYILLLVAGSVRNIPGYALGYWLPTYYSKVFQVGSHDYGPKVGLVVLFGGALGCFLGGALSDWSVVDVDF